MYKGVAVAGVAVAGVAVAGVGWWGVAGWREWVGSRRRANPTIKRHTAVECVQ